MAPDQRDTRSVQGGIGPVTRALLRCSACNSGQAVAGNRGVEQPFSFIKVVQCCIGSELHASSNHTHGKRIFIVSNKLQEDTCMR